MTRTELDKFVIRMPGDLRTRVAAAARRKHMGTNAFIVQQLEQALQGDGEMQLLLEGLRALGREQLKEKTPH